MPLNYRWANRRHGGARDGAGRPAVTCGCKHCGSSGAKLRRTRNLTNDEGAVLEKIRVFQCDRCGTVFEESESCVGDERT